MARHAAPRKSRGRAIAAAAVAALVAVAVVVTVVLFSTPGDKKSTANDTNAGQPTAPGTSAPSCAQRPSLRVIAASGIAPVVKSVAAGTCVQLDLTVDDTVKPAATLKAGRADVWIPDSRARAVLAGNAAASAAPSVAVSPIIIAADADLDTARYAGTRSLTWNALLQQATLAPLKLEVQNPRSSSTSLILASALNGLAQTASGDRYSALATTAVASATLRAADGADIPASTLRVEEARLVGDSDKILDMAGGYPQLDYPWVTAAKPHAAAKAATRTLLSALQGDAGDTARHTQKLLDPGAIALEPGSYVGARSAALLPGPPVEQIPTLYAVADAGAQHGNILAVLDVSGSMSEPADTTGGAQTKMQAVQSSAALAMQLLSGESRVGLWQFGSQLDPPNDYLKTLPLRPLSASRGKLLDAVNAVQVRPTSGTSLYRTVLDAYRNLQANWQRGYANSLLVFTDGKDEDDPAGISLQTLQTQLKAAANPAKPIQVILLGYGQADIPAMTAISSTVGGVVYRINSPTQLVGAFIDAISQSVLNSLATES